MDKFLTFPNSRIPIWQDDFAFIQNSAQNGIALAIKSMLPPAMRTAQKVIIYGCEITKDNNEYTTTAGLVMIDGEVLEVQASTENFEDTPTFVVDSSFEQTGDRTDTDGNSRRCYNIRRAKLGIGESGDVYWMIPRANQQVLLHAASTVAGGPTPYSMVTLYLDVVNGRVYFKFSCYMHVINPTDGQFTPIYAYISQDKYYDAYASLFLGRSWNTIERYSHVFIDSQYCPAVLRVTDNSEQRSMLLEVKISIDHQVSSAGSSVAAATISNTFEL